MYRLLALRGGQDGLSFFYKGQRWGVLTVRRTRNIWAECQGKVLKRKMC